MDAGGLGETEIGWGSQDQLDAVCREETTVDRVGHLANRSCSHLAGAVEHARASSGSTFLVYPDMGFAVACEVHSIDLNTTRVRRYPSFRRSGTTLPAVLASKKSDHACIIFARGWR